MSVRAKPVSHRSPIPVFIDSFGLKPWHRRGNCISADPEIFFNRADWQEAKAVCRGCPVRAQCLAEFRDDGWAVAGGMDPDERKAARRRGLL